MNEDDVRTEFQSHFYGYFLADSLLQVLPFRRKWYVFGPKVLEYAGLLEVMKSAFLIGSSLGIVNRTAAIRIIDSELGAEVWNLPNQDFEARLARSSAEAVSYELLFPAYAKPGPKGAEALSVQQSGQLVAGQTYHGLIFGVNHPDAAQVTIKNWIAATSAGSTRLGVGGLSMSPSPQMLALKSVQDALAAAQVGYEEWLRAPPY